MEFWEGGHKIIRSWACELSETQSRNIISKAAGRASDLAKPGKCAILKTPVAHRYHSIRYNLHESGAWHIRNEPFTYAVVTPQYSIWYNQILQTYW